MAYKRFRHGMSRHRRRSGRSRRGRFSRSMGMRKVARRAALSLFELRVRKVRNDSTLAPYARPLALVSGKDLTSTFQRVQRGDAAVDVSRGMLNAPTNYEQGIIWFNPNGVTSLNRTDMPSMEMPEFYAWRDGLRVMQSATSPEGLVGTFHFHHRVGCVNGGPTLFAPAGVQADPDLDPAPALVETGGQGHGYISVAANHQWHYTNPPSGISFGVDSHSRIGSMVRQEFVKVQMQLMPARIGGPRLTGSTPGDYLYTRKGVSLADDPKFFLNVAAAASLPGAGLADTYYPTPTWAMVVFFTFKRSDTTYNEQLADAEAHNDGSYVGAFANGEDTLRGRYRPAARSHILSWARNRHSMTVRYPLDSGGTGFTYTKPAEVPDEIYLVGHDLSLPLKDGRLIREPSDVEFDKDIVRIWKTDVVRFPERDYYGQNAEAYHDQVVPLDRRPMALATNTAGDVTDTNVPDIDTDIDPGQTVLGTRSLYAEIGGLAGGIRQPLVNRTYHIGLNGAPVRFDDSRANTAWSGTTDQVHPYLNQNTELSADSVFSIGDRQLYCTVITPCYPFPVAFQNPAATYNASVDSVAVPPWGSCPVKVKMQTVYGYRDT